MNFINDTDSLDQHFLIDQTVIDKLIEISSLNKEETVVEVGPGKGNITKLIAPKVKKLYTIELDNRLKEFEVKSDNIEYIYDNVLDTYIPECDKIITCLPYSIIEPFIVKVIKCKVKKIIMITGNKYADNVIGFQKTKLSLLTNCYFNVSKIMEIVPSSFEPKPRVMSALLELDLKPEEEVTDSTLLLFRYMFLYHDKKVKNGLIESFIKYSKLRGQVLTQKMSKEIVEKLEIAPYLLTKTFNTCSNEDLNILYEVVENYFNK